MQGCIWLRLAPGADNEKTELVSRAMNRQQRAWDQSHAIKKRVGSGLP